MSTRRSDFLIIGGAIAVAVATPPLLRRVQRSRLAFEPIAQLPGFRKIEGQGVTLSGPVVLVGIDRPSQAEDRAIEAAMADPCTAAFGAQGWPKGGPLPIAVFSDYNCPNCPQASAQLRQLQSSGAAVRIVWHDLPILGPASERAARLAVAAGMLGAYEAAHGWLMHRAIPPGPAGARRLAAAISLDEHDLARLAQGPDVAARLAKTRAAAAAFGVLGTPTMIVGRTRVTGTLPDETLEKLIKREISEVTPLCR